MARSLVHQKIVFLWGLLSVLVQIASSSSLQADGTRVMQLTDENFEYLTQSASGQTTGKWFVSFSAVECGHCAKLRPIWDDLAQEISEHHSDSGVIAGTVNIRENPRLAHRFGIEAMPTLILFAEQGMYEYEPSLPRLVSDFVAFTLGGYKTSESGGKKKAVPTHGGLLKFVEDIRRLVYDVSFLKDLLADFEEIIMLRKNAGAVIFVAGTIFGIFISSLTRLTLKTKPNKAKED